MNDAVELTYVSENKITLGAGKVREIARGAKDVDYHPALVAECQRWDAQNPEPIVWNELPVGTIVRNIEDDVWYSIAVVEAEGLGIPYKVGSATYPGTRVVVDQFVDHRPDSYRVIYRP